MAVHYLGFQVQISTLEIEDAAEVERIRTEIEAAVRSIKMTGVPTLNISVWVDLYESAGTPSVGSLPD